MPHRWYTGTSPVASSYNRVCCAILAWLRSIVLSPHPLFCIALLHCWVIFRDTSHLQYIATFNIANLTWFLCRLCFSIVVFWCQLNSLACVRMHMYHFHRYTHTALSVAYGTVYTCLMGRFQRWCMYLVVCDAILVIIQPSTEDNTKCDWNYIINNEINK